MKKNFRRK